MSSWIDRQQPQPAGRRGHQLQLLRRVCAGLATQRRPEQLQHQRRRPIQQAHNRPRHPDKQVHRPRDGQRNALGPLQRQRLRHNFAEHNLKVGDEEERQHHGRTVRQQQRVRRRPRVLRQTPQQVLHPRRNRRLAQTAQHKIGQRHAQLNRRQHLVDVVLQAQRRMRRRPFTRKQVLNPGLAHAHQRELRGHKEAVRKNAQCDQTSAQE